MHKIARTSLLSGETSLRRRQGPAHSQCSRLRAQNRISRFLEMTATMTPSQKRQVRGC